MKRKYRRKAFKAALGAALKKKGKTISKNTDVTVSLYARIFVSVYATESLYLKSVRVHFAYGSGGRSFSRVC